VEGNLLDVRVGDLEVEAVAEGAQRLDVVFARITVGRSVAPCAAA
jgi:hypothetical protein